MIGQRRIDDGDARQHALIADRDLAAMFGQADHRIARGLGPGAGSGWQRHEWQGRGLEGQAQPDNLEMVHDAARRRDQRRQRLAHIQRRAAPQRDHPFRAGATQVRQRGLKHRQAGFGPAGNRRDLGAGRAQRLKQPARAGRIRAMDQHAACAKGADQRRRLLRLVPAKDHSARQGELKRGEGHLGSGMQAVHNSCTGTKTRSRRFRLIVYSAKCENIRACKEQLRAVPNRIN